MKGCNSAEGGPRDDRFAAVFQIDGSDQGACRFTIERSLLLNPRTNTELRRRGIAAVTAAATLLTTGCVCDPNACSTPLLQSLGDGLGSAISALFEAALLSILI
jgi:hypothetical protein